MAREWKRKQGRNFLPAQTITKKLNAQRNQAMSWPFSRTGLRLMQFKMATHIFDLRFKSYKDEQLLGMVYSRTLKSNRTRLIFIPV